MTLEYHDFILIKLEMSLKTYVYVETTRCSFYMYTS